MRRCEAMVLPVVFLFAASAGICGQSEAISLWAVDPLVKVFRDTPSTTSAPKVELCGGANEFISGQVAIRSDHALAKVAARWQPLRHRNGAYTLPAESLRWRFVGFVPVPKNSVHTPACNLARTAPCDFPDPLPRFS